MNKSEESLKRQMEKLEKDFNFKKLCSLIDELSPERKEALKRYLEQKEQGLYSPEQFARITGIPIARVRRWLREGHIKGQKISRSWLIPYSELERVLSPDE